MKVQVQMKTKQTIITAATLIAIAAIGFAVLVSRGRGSTAVPADETSFEEKVVKKKPVKKASVPARAKPAKASPAKATKPKPAIRRRRSYLAQ